MSGIIPHQIYQPSNPYLAFHKVKKSSEYMKLLENEYKNRFVPIYGDQDEALEKIKSREDRVCEVLVDNETAVGFIVYKKDLQQPLPNDGVVDSFELMHLSLINIKYQTKKNYQEFLWKRVKKLATKAFARGIHIAVSAQEHSLIEFLRDKHNFKVRQTWKDRHLPGVDDYLLYRSLITQKNGLFSPTMKRVVETNQEKRKISKRKRERSPEPQDIRKQTTIIEESGTRPGKRRGKESDYRSWDGDKSLSDSKQYDDRRDFRCSTYQRMNATTTTLGRG